MLVYLLSLMNHVIKMILMTPMSLLFASCPPDVTLTTVLEVSNDGPKNYRQTGIACTFLILHLLCFLKTVIEISVVIVLDLWSLYCTPLPLIPLIS